jgi:hypothetical protein
MIPKTLAEHNVAWPLGEKLSTSLWMLSAWAFGREQYDIHLLLNPWMALAYYAAY